MIDGAMLAAINSSKNSYCTGEAGIEASESQKYHQHAISDEITPTPRKSLLEHHRKSAADDNQSADKLVSWSSMDERKRSYASSLLGLETDGTLTEEQLEIYRCKRLHAADPMKNYITSKDASS
jgi:hypothetical protein